MAGISNQNILKFIEEKTIDDIKKNFAAVFPSNFITKLIMFHSMLNKKGAWYLYIIMNTDYSNKKVTIGGVFLTFIQKKKYFYSTALDFIVSKNFYYKMIKKFLIKFFMELKKLKKKTAK